MKLSSFRKQLLFIFADNIAIIISFALLGFLRQDYVLISAYLFTLIYLFATKRKNLVYYFVASSFVSLLWNIAVNEQYGYNYDYISIFSLNIYSILAWALGLFAAYLMYSELKLNKKSFPAQLILFSLLYWILLISVETTAYHLFGIMNIESAEYPGLPICNCIHAPIWMQISYFTIGPLYFALCYLLGFGKKKKFINIAG
jgi:hypothetical protein